MRAYHVKKRDSFNGCERDHFEPLYADSTPDVLADNQVALDVISEHRVQHPGECHEVVFVLSTYKKGGAPRTFEDLDIVIQDLFAEKLQSCWQSQSPVPLASDRCEEVLARMKESLRDSVLNDLRCCCDVTGKPKRDVLKSLLRNSPEFGPLSSLVVLKSDSFSHFAYCDENCARVNVSMPVHFRLPADLPSPRAFDIFEQDWEHVRELSQVLGKPFIDQFLEHLRSSGFEVALAFSNINSTFCTLKLVFPVDRVRGDATCVGARALELKQAIEAYFREPGPCELVGVDELQVCLAKGTACPTCGFTSDLNSMFCYRRNCHPELMEYMKIFECASAALPEPPAEIAGTRVCKGLDRGPESICWLKRVVNEQDAEGPKVFEPNVSLSNFEIGNVLLTHAVSSFSTDFGSNLLRYATPAAGFAKATVFVVERPHMSARFIDPVSVIPFLAPKFSESECHIEKDTELRLTEIKPKHRGDVAAINCDTYVFTLVTNFNKLSPSGIANLEIPWITLRNAIKVCRAAPQDGFTCVADFMMRISGRVSLSDAARDEVQKSLTAKTGVMRSLTGSITGGALSFGCRDQQQPAPPAPASPTRPSTDASSQDATPPTVLKSKPDHQDAPPLEFPDSIPVLLPLFYLSCRPPCEFNADSPFYEWAGGVLPRGSCPCAENHPERTMVYSFKQLLHATYHDGQTRTCKCPQEGQMSEEQELLLQEAETVDNFMLELRGRDGLTQQDIENRFERSETETRSSNSKLVIRANFLEQCRQVIGMQMQHSKCECCHKAHHNPPLFNDNGLPCMNWSCYKRPIKNPTHYASDFVAQCDSE